MTRKDYELIAEVIRNQETHNCMANFGIFIADLIVALSKDNPRFNCEKFLNACKP